MAWMVVHQEVNWSRPGCKFGFRALPKPDPQQFPHDFVEHAVTTGRATRVSPPRRTPKQGA